MKSEKSTIISNNNNNDVEIIIVRQCMTCRRLFGPYDTFNILTNDGAYFIIYRLIEPIPLVSFECRLKVMRNCVRKYTVTPQSSFSIAFNSETIDYLLLLSLRNLVCLRSQVIYGPDEMKM